MAAGALILPTSPLSTRKILPPVGASGSPRASNSATIELAECRGRGDRMLFFSPPRLGAGSGLHRLGLVSVAVRLSRSAVGLSGPGVSSPRDQTRSVTSL